MSTTTSYPRVLRLLALLSAVVLVSWGSALSPAGAVAHGNSHKTEKSNNGNGAANGNAANGNAANGNAAAQSDKSTKTNNGHSTSSSSESHTTSSTPASSNSSSAPASPGSSKGADKSQSSHGSAAAPGQSGAGVEQSQAASKSASSTSKSSGGKGDPAGNNGTVKLAGFDAPNGPGHSSGDGSTPMHPSNDPHLPCTFAVEGYGFDSVASHSYTAFDQHAPTGGGYTQKGSVLLDGDSHSGGGSTAGYDGVQGYTLTFVGDPHPIHGYHVKLTATTDYSQGSNVKHKVFWVEPCETTPPPPEEECPNGDMNGDAEGCEAPPTEECPNGDMNGDAEGCEAPPTDNNVPPVDNNNPPNDSNNPNGGSTSTVVLGAQASVGAGQSAPGAAPSAAGAQVPTAIESGQAGNEQHRQPLLPLLALLFGFGVTVVALTRRKASV